MSKTAVQELVDVILDLVRNEHPGVEYSITLSQANSLLLPLHDRQLSRVAEGRVGYYGGHVYRDAMVWDVNMSDWLFVVTPVRGADAPSDQAPAYYGDLRNGGVSTTLPC